MIKGCLTLSLSPGGHARAGRSSRGLSGGSGGGASVCGEDVGSVRTRTEARASGRSEGTESEEKESEQNE